MKNLFQNTIVESIIIVHDQISFSNKSGCFVLLQDTQSQINIIKIP